MRLLVIVMVVLGAGAGWAEVLDGRMHHLRAGEAEAAPEWAEFSAGAEGREYVVRWTGRANAGEGTLRVRHRDLRFNWVARVNGVEAFRLPVDEKETVTYWAVPGGIVREGNNELRISANGAKGEVDDVMIGEAEWVERPRAAVVSAGTVEVMVVGERGLPMPGRITVADERGALIDLGNVSDERTSVRAGVVYTGDGHATLRLAAGSYTVYAGRGFEYTVDAAKVVVREGDALTQAFHLRRVVPTEGYVACDTHVHTFTYSRHGDATLAERLITLAGEGVELPIATDHNLTVDYASVGADSPAARWFTPVIGEEVTTGALGHFNVFPLSRGGKLVDWRAPTWGKLGQEIEAKAGEGAVVILNHARDVHGKFRPFDPARHVSCAGEEIDGVAPPANAMEVINSGATTNDPMVLVRDWMGMVNRGHAWTPVGASDSHDVSRYIVGQGRTYVRSDAAAAGSIDVAEAVRSFRAGRVLVSYGLIADVSVAGKYGPGELVPAAALKDADELEVTLRVLGPDWTRASSIALYLDGEEVRREAIDEKGAAGVKWEGTWRLPKPKHDVWLTAVALGPGVEAPYWAVAKPYQPTSPEWRSYVMGVSGAVRVDADGSGAYESPAEYARRIVAEVGGDVNEAVAELSGYDPAVAIQAASLLRAKWGEGFAAKAREALHGAGPGVRVGVERYLQEVGKLAAGR